jgi:hypothetical protein
LSFSNAWQRCIKKKLIQVNVERFYLLQEDLAEVSGSHLAVVVARIGKSGSGRARNASRTFTRLKLSRAEKVTIC